MIPDILALDFDGVLCDGMREYFETSRRTFVRVWPTEPAPGENLFRSFSTLRPVILSGWEMPVLLRAIERGRTESAILQNWEAVRDDVIAAGTPAGDKLVDTLKHTVDEVRREWIAATPGDWREQNVPYWHLDEVTRPPRERPRAPGGPTQGGQVRAHIPRRR